MAGAKSFRELKVYVAAREAAKQVFAVSEHFPREERYALTDQIRRSSRAVVNSIYIDDRVKDYIVDVVWATREPATYNLNLDGLIRYGASPRATIYLALAARAHAFLNGRGYVTPQDVKSIGTDVLRHRVIVSYEAEAETITSETIVDRIFAGLPVP